MFNKKNIIIFAAGGGNDVFSAMAYAKAYLCDYDFDQVALISVLGFTPFHSNDPIKINDVNTEQPFIKPTQNMHRYLQLHNPKEIYNMEKLIPNMLQDFAPEIVNYICMSPKYSAIEQANNLRQLFNEWNMLPENTLLNIVDFGGDILTNGKQSSIISPGLDAFTLAVVQNLSEYLSKISVCFPGVDGELQKDYLTTCCNDSAKYEINTFKWYNILDKIYDKIKDKRIGNTIPNMIKTLMNMNLNDNTFNVTKKWIIGKQSYSFTKEIDLNLDLQKYVHIFNAINYNPFVDIFNSTDYELTKVIKHITTIYDSQNIDKDTIQSSDFHLQFLRKDLDNKWTNKHLVYGDSNQNVMMVNIIPYPILIDKCKINGEINNLKTFDILYSTL